ncbi:O-antigen ligase family protein [uncultured Marinobacter sp.]|uniref:O-antigen ligase family protein n=1 Tax=uncultured Marinobacter sp. TaxID=187379 RepID=UPI000C10A7A6|nr:O-antigen ligase family protein [uncultured Marinobacter sp.]PHQ75643.1 MAG: hypothetical protein COB82_01800 [Marinobacter sp.]
MRKKVKEIADEDLYSLNIGKTWRYFKSESFAFWMICAYLFFEYVRPQSIYPAIDFLPWTQLTVIGALIGCFADRTVRWVSSSVNVLLILFLIVILLSSVFAYFPSVSYKNLDKYYLWVIIYFLIINIVNTRKRFFIFLCVFLVASFKISLSLAITWAQRGFSFTSWGLSGPPGFFQNSGELAIQMLVFWPIAWAFTHSLKPHVSKNWYRLLMLMPITAIMVILGASSRGAQLALVIQLVVMNYRTIFKPKVLLSCCVSIFLIWTFLPDEQKERFETMGEDRTSRQRILYVENGIEMIKDNPLFGVGYFNFVPYYNSYYRHDLLGGRAELPHNIFVQVGTDTGLLGLSIFLGIIFVAFKTARKVTLCQEEEKRAKFASYANISLIGFLVAGQFVTVTYYPFLWIHLALLISMRNSFEKPG